MIHPHTTIKWIDPEKGFGVFATDFIPRGTIVYARDPLEIAVTPFEYERLDPNMQEAVEKYSYIDERGDRIVSWDLGKYVNHCCHPNTISTGYGFEIAIRDIHPGEEITDEYGIFNLTHIFPLGNCQATCRKAVGPTDFETQSKRWDQLIIGALPEVFHVAQPLWFLLPQEVLAGLEAFVDNPETYWSVEKLKHVSVENGSSDTVQPQSIPPFQKKN